MQANIPSFVSYGPFASSYIIKLKKKHWKAFYLYKYWKQLAISQAKVQSLGAGLLKIWFFNVIYPKHK